MAVIFWLSSGSFAAEETAPRVFAFLRFLLPWAGESQLALLHGLGRKAGHVLEYAVLAWLWHRAFSKTLPGRPHARSAFGLTLAYAVFDELHQGWTGWRDASAFDVGLDALGGAGALALLRWGWRRLAERLTTVLLWLAAAGGSLLLAVRLLAGVPGSWLWASVPLAWIALWGWWRTRRLGRPARWR
jgi:VanZ family protein